MATWKTSLSLLVQTWCLFDGTFFRFIRILNTGTHVWSKDHPGVGAETLIQDPAEKEPVIKVSGQFANGAHTGIIFFEAILFSPVIIVVLSEDYRRVEEVFLLGQVTVSTFRAFNVHGFWAPCGL